MEKRTRQIVEPTLTPFSNRRPCSLLLVKEAFFGGLAQNGPLTSRVPISDFCPSTALTHSASTDPAHDTSVDSQLQLPNPSWVPDPLSQGRDPAVSRPGEEEVNAYSLNRCRVGGWASDEHGPEGSLVSHFTLRLPGHLFRISSGTHGCRTRGRRCGQLRRKKQSQRHPQDSQSQRCPRGLQSQRGEAGPAHLGSRREAFYTDLHSRDAAREEPGERRGDRGCSLCSPTTSRVGQPNPQRSESQ